MKQKTGIKQWAGLALVLCSTAAFAAGGTKPADPAQTKWKDECGSCHVAYPPQLLTAPDWQRLMGTMDKHFGANAALDPKDAKDILTYLQSHAGSGARHSANSLRISDTQWFTRAHHELPGGIWVNAAVKSRSNCTACHINAERGDWSERGVRLPGSQRKNDN